MSVRALRWVASATVVTFVFRTVWWSLTIAGSRSSSEHKQDCSQQETIGGTGLVVIVPLLNETARTSSLITYFSGLHADGDVQRLILVTTSREHDSGVGALTSEICANMADMYHWVFHVHVDDPGGAMASQINGAVLDCGLVEDDALLAIYNVDSRPHPASLRVAEQLLREGQRNSVVQQHGLYLRNFSGIALRGGGQSLILLAAAAWQTRWSMGFERYHARLNASKRYGPIRGFSYVIGHGLFIRAKVIRSIGGLTERFSNEDAHLSLALAMRGIRIIPHPLWEIADSPDSVPSLITQKRVWFGGPAHAFSYRNDLTPMAKNRSEKVALVGSTFALFNHALCWLAGPVMTVLLVIATCIARRPWYGVAVTTAAFMYVALPNDMALRAASEISHVQINRSLRLTISLGALPVYVLHGFSAVTGAWNVVREVASGRRLAKPPTRMMHDFEDATERIRLW